MRIIGVGDIMPGGILAGINAGYVSQDVLDVLQDADIRVGTLETAIGNEPNFNEEKMKRKGDVIYAQDEDLNKLKQLSIDIVSLANNHFFDLGIDGGRHTIQLLDALGIKHIGAGNNIKEASSPAIETVRGQKIAFLAFCDLQDTGWCPFASDTDPGVNPMYDDYVVAEIKKYKKQNDYVVVIPHWGKEHTWVTTTRVYRLTKKMIKAGADLILGSHPHRVQPVINYKKASVAYSMGNFLFPDRLITKPRSTYYPPKPIDLSTLPVTDEYPYVECVTYKKWKPLARVGMVVLSDLDGKTSRSSFKLTRENEDGVISFVHDKKIDAILSHRKQLLRYYPYPAMVFMERCSKAFLRKVKIKKDRF